MAPAEANQDARTAARGGESPRETAPMEKPPAPLSAGNMLARLAGIGVLLLGVAGAFLYLGGWFSPQQLTPPRFVDEFERANGIHSGFGATTLRALVFAVFLTATGMAHGFRRPQYSRPAGCLSSAAFPSREAFLMPPTLQARSMDSACCSKHPTAKNGGPQ